jgi:hypothetical protein
LKNNPSNRYVACEEAGSVKAIDSKTRGTKPVTPQLLGGNPSTKAILHLMDKNDLHVKVRGDDITVTDADHTVTYKKWADQPHLILTYSFFDLTARAASEFRACAWTAANDKARELGWIA